MASKYFLSIQTKHTVILQQAQRHTRCMGTLAYQYLNSQHEHDAEGAEWSNKLSFASPESDFVGGPFSRNASLKPYERSHSLSFTSPEADFTAERVPEAVERPILPSDPADTTMLFSSPESAFGFVHMAEVLTEPIKAKFLASQGVQYKPAQNEMMFQEFVHDTTLMAAPETASGFVASVEMLDEESKALLSRLHSRVDALPKTLEEAMADPRAIVVTSLKSPFDIVDVNDAWVGLCGYEREEALNYNLGQLLQGPDTNTQTAQNIIAQLRQEHFANATITNYTKQGRKFRNKVQAGILADDHGRAKYFVGVLEEMYDYEAGKLSM